VAKARVGLYNVTGGALTRTHRACPKCGPGTYLAEHSNRRSCGRCGFSEPKTPTGAPSGKPRPTKSA